MSENAHRASAAVHCVFQLGVLKVRFVRMLHEGLPTRVPHEGSPLRDGSNVLGPRRNVGCR